ncbi:MAG: hypothetical protein AVDCRST_MAG77-1750 [uncultured Chloroflexi bacterium]|uniref:ParB-like N-terminal domain-containing protein n=1 Tax=uncultured Chloroflexota bacterium TaxID=166587 RepID=A0A6J4IBB5_9CHLR|nr:MAG: hypothetical protein AVDCRST_MAG77-1750 [uncultured Chloroflexota bacterium]
MATEGLKRTAKPGLQPDEAALLAPLDALLPGRNARSAWETMDERLLQLADSIQEQGILEPLLVRELHARPEGRAGGTGAAGRRFELIAGFRRFAAAKYLSMERVPVRLLRASDEDALALNLAENLARADLNDADALRSVVQLQETYGWGVRKIARATGRSASWVSEILAVARSQREREAVEAGRLAVGGAARMSRLKSEFPEVRDALLERLDRGDTVMIEEVPRLAELRQDVARAQGEVAHRAGAGTPGPRIPPVTPLPSSGETPAVDLPVAARAQAPRQMLTLNRQDQSLVRNAETLMHQTLVALSVAWTEQGYGCTLPPDVRDSLRRSADAIETFLTRDASV